MKIKYLLFLFLITVSVKTLIAQDGHDSYRPNNIKISAQTNNSDTFTNNENLTGKQRDAAKPFEIDFGNEIITHFHNIFVHFPIALSLLAFLYTMANFKWKKYDDTIKYLVVSAAITCYPTLQSGFNQAAEFTAEPMKSVVDIHLNLGILSLAALVSWAVFLYKEKLKKYAWLIAIAAAIIISITGFYGGIIAHADL